MPVVRFIKKKALVVEKSTAVEKKYNDE